MQLLIEAGADKEAKNEVRYEMKIKKGCKRTYGIVRRCDGFEGECGLSALALVVLSIIFTYNILQ